MLIDSDKKWTLARTVQVRGRRRLVHSDHFPCLLTFNNLPRGQEVKEGKQTKWNLAKEGGWEQYKKVSDELSDKVKEAIEDDENSVEETKKEFDKVHDKIRFKAFGKVTIHKKDNGDRKKDKDNIEYKGTTDEEKAEELFQEKKLEQQKRLRR